MLTLRSAFFCDARGALGVGHVDRIAVDSDSTLSSVVFVAHVEQSGTVALTRGGVAVYYRGCVRRGSAGATSKIEVNAVMFVGTYRD